MDFFRSVSAARHAAAWAVLAASPTWAAEPARRAPGLDAAVHASWTRTPLREWAVRVTVIAGKPLILDRRLDPTALVTIDCRGQPLRDVLATVADQVDADVEELRSSLRMVPRGRAGLASSADDALARTVAGLPAAVRQRVSVRNEWAWPDGARPSELIATAARAGGIEIEGLDAVPHDHFAAASLPALSLAERLDLVLAHYDLRVQWERGRPAGRILPIDEGVVRRPAGDTKPADRPARPRPTVRLKDSFSLRVEAPLDQALAAIAKRIGLGLDIDTASLQARGIAAGEIVRADVKEVSRDQLLRTLLEPLGLEHRIEDDTLRVFAPPR